MWGTVSFCLDSRGLQSWIQINTLLRWQYIAQAKSIFEIRLICILGYSDFTLHNCFCIDGNQNYCHDFKPTDLSIWPGGQGAFTFGTWHRMEYKQVAISGSSNAQYSITINDIEVWTKENSTPREVPDISLYYGYTHYWEAANGKIRNLVWEEL